MWARWITLLAVVGCQAKQQTAAKATGSATVVAAAPADAQPIDAAPPKLAIACGPAMLAPRIPAPPKKQASVDDALIQLLGQPGLGMQPGDTISNGVGVGVGGGTGGGMIAPGRGIGTGGGDGYGRSNGGDRPASLTIDSLAVQGSLDQDLVRKMLVRARPKLIACFEKDLKKAGYATDRAHANAKLVIGTKGDVMQAYADGDSHDCVEAVVKAIRFPPPKGGGIATAAVQLTYLIEINSGRGVMKDLMGHPLATTYAAPKPVEKPPPIPDTRSWTPYAASLGLASDDTAQAAGDELVKLMPLAKLEKCFAGKDASERAMVTVAFDGAVIGARTGGSGDAQVDSCIAVSLIGLKVTAPPTVSEVACDIVRGDPQPWRVAPESYTVIEVGDKEIKEGGVALTKDKLVPAKADATHAFLIVVDPLAPPVQVARAFRRTQWAGATLVALKNSGGSPVFIAMGLDGRMREKDYAPMLGIQHVKDDVKSCVDKDARGTAPKAEVETLLQTLANACDPKPCPATVSIALGGTMQDLAADADAARRAKLTRIGLSTTGCP